jgi:serine/threonine-protein kinase RsbW
MTARLHRMDDTRASVLGRHEWVIESDVQAITPVVESVQSMCVAAGFSQRHCRLNIPVSITEALANAIERGNCDRPTATVRVTVILDESTLCVEVTDEGSGFDANSIAHSPADSNWLLREDGRGLFLMRSLMDNVESHCVECGGHTLKLTLRRT